MVWVELENQFRRQDEEHWPRSAKRMAKSLLLLPNAYFLILAMVKYTRKKY